MSEALDLETPRPVNDAEITVESSSHEESAQTPSALEGSAITEPAITSKDLSLEKVSSTPPEDTKEPIPSLEAAKPGECNNLLPVLVERLRSALEQSCSSQSSEEASQPLEDSGVDSEEDLRVWASGLMDQRRAQEAQSPRALKLDLKFLEDLLLSDIQTGLARLQETLKEVDINTLTRYSSTLDPTNKLNLLKLISSLLANLKIPKPEKTVQSQTVLPRRRRSDRHTIGVSAEELARARKWLEEKNLNSGVVEPCAEAPLQTARALETSFDDPHRKNATIGKDSTIERLEVDKNEKVQDKCMKDAINQQQSMQSKSRESQKERVFYDPPAAKPLDTSYKDDNAIVNEEFGISASSLYHQSSTKSNKFLAKKSKIKRANTIDIPNYLKLQAESLAKVQNGCASLRRPINVGDRFFSNGGHVIPSFEPKTENDRKFLALISKNTENTATSPGAILPFKSFSYRQADKNWNSRFSNIKTTFDKPQDESEARGKDNTEIVANSPKIPGNGMRTKPGFSHAPTSAFQKIEKVCKEQTSPGFLKPGYVPKGGSLLQAKVKIFDQENLTSQPILTKSNRSKARQLDPRRGNMFSSPESAPETGHLNYHSFCKQFAPFTIKNSHQKRTPWGGNVIGEKIKDEFEWKVEKKDDSKSSKGSENQERGDNRMMRKLYDGNTVMSEPRDVVAFPFEVNYQRRGFGTKIRDNVEEKGKYESPETARQLRSPPTISLQYIKSALEGSNLSAPPRGIFSVASVAVQTRQMDPPRPVYPVPRTMGIEDTQRRPALAGGVKNGIGVGKEVKEPAERVSRKDLVDQQAQRGSIIYGENFVDPIEGQIEDLAEHVRRGSRVYEDLAYPCQPPHPIKPHRGNLTEELRRSSRQYAENLEDPYQPPLPPKPHIDDFSNHLRRGSSHYADDSFDPYPPPLAVKPQSEDFPKELRSSNHYEDNLSSNYQPSHLIKIPTDELSGHRRGSRHCPENLVDQSYQPPLPIKSHTRDLPVQTRRGSKHYADTLIDPYQPPLPIKPHTEHLPEQTRRGSRHYTDYPIDLYERPVKSQRDDQRGLRHYADDSDYYQPPSPPPPPVLPQREDTSFSSDSPAFNAYSGQGRHLLPHTTSHPPTYHYPPNTDYNRPQYYSSTEANAQNSFGQTPPQIPLRANPPQKASQPHIKADYYPRYENRRYEDPRIQDFRESLNFHDARCQNPISQRPSGNVPDNRLPTVLLQPSSHAYYSHDTSSFDGSADASEDQSFAEDEKIQNQDISSEGIVTRYACAIATVSSASESPAISPLPILKEDPLPQKIFEAPHKSGKDDLTLEEVRRHNLLQQSLIRQLQEDGKTSRDERLRSPTKPPEESTTEVVIESNNTQDKINIFESRNSSTTKQQVFKPLSIPRAERENFASSKSNVAHPSKNFKPSFNADTRGAKIQAPVAAGQKKSVDSSDEYLMSCANKPSRSIVLSKSESWHQLAMTKSSLQVPQSQPSSLVKLPKPKSPSSLKLSKQYEASSSSDAIRKMEDKIQRYFQGPSGAPDSPNPTRRDPKTKRNFAGRKTQGNLSRSHTMPHIYDDTTDVDKAFDSLFKEATRTDNRY